MEAKNILKAIAEYANDSAAYLTGAYLATSSNYARGYRDGVMRAKEIISEILDECNPRCPKCGAILTPSEVDGYEWQCAECDEDFYNIEVDHPNE